jgi:hypothetical protein
MAFKNPSLSDSPGKYLSKILNNPPKSMLSMNTTPAKRITKESHGSIPGISLKKKNKNKNEPIHKKTNESKTSLVVG